MQQFGNEMVGFGDDLVAPVIETRPVDTAAVSYGSCFFLFELISGGV